MLTVAQHAHAFAETEQRTTELRGFKVEYVWFRPNVRSRRRAD